MNRFFYAILGTFLLSLSFQAIGQTLNLNQFKVEDGLPQSCIYTLTQDFSGSIWIGTMDGVSRYDGLKFENFSVKDSLAEHRVTASCVDKGGAIWFGHWQGGISKYNPITKKFHRVKTGSISVLKSIQAIQIGNNGELLFSTNGQGIIRYQPSKDELLHGTDTESGNFSLLNRSNGLPSEFCNGAFWDNQKRKLFVATSEGVVVSTNESKFEPIALLQDINATSLLLDEHNNLWVGTSAKGLLCYSAQSNKIKSYTTNEGLASNYVKCLIEDLNHSIFIGTYGGGVSKFLPALEANNYKGPVFQTISSNQGLSNDKVLALLQDREKNIWIGTSLYLNQYFDEQFEIYGENEGLKSSLIWSLTGTKDGKFWVGTEGGLVEVIKNQNPSQYGFVNHSEKLKEGVISNTTALYEDKKGRIWYSNYGNGVCCFSPSTNKTICYSTKEGLCNNEVNAINGDKDGNLWMGTTGGLSKFNIENETFENVKSAALGSDKIFTIYKDRKNNLWLGTLGGALTMYDGNSFKKFTSKDGYDNLFTVSITEDNNGNMWFGSFDKGIYKYDGTSFKNYTTKDGATSDQSFMLVCDNLNNLWIGNNQGIDKFNIQEQSFKHYGKQDGFLGVEINPNAVYKDADGTIWFGSIIGIVKYSGQNEKTNLVEPKLELFQPRLFYKSAQLPADHIFSYKMNHFTFDFVGASLTNPKRVSYKYKLEGYDSDWSLPQKQNFATYSNLPAGNYTFKVIAANNDGVWNKEPQTFTFSITPPFWKTIWFWAIIGILVVGLTIAYFRFREKRLLKANLLLEQKVMERTEELRKEKELVEVQNQNIKDSIDYAQRIQEAIFVPLGEIKKLLPDFFILFQPKDIVSGDFYWVHEKNGKVLFAVADCTGHGVPGAFMSIIGYNLLNNVILERGVTTPSLILDELSKDITKTLSANAQGQKVKDGMDIAICSYDPVTKILEFAGAHNSMYHVRGRALSEYKADKQPVGKSSMHDVNFHFTNHTLRIESGDHVFLFTDGYADAIGGPKRTKFYYPPFRKLLEEGTALSLEEQRVTLQRTIKDWLGSRDQVDDIAIMGVKF